MCEPSTRSLHLQHVSSQQFLNHSFCDITGETSDCKGQVDKMNRFRAFKKMIINCCLFFVLCREIIDNTGKENGIDIVMPERTYHLIAESAEDAR